MTYRPILQQGQMYWLLDSAVEFAETKGRLPHEESRCCVVVEGNKALQRMDSDTVTIVPTSGRVDIKSEYDVFLPNPPSPKKDTMVRIEAVQTILREELGDYVQLLKPEFVTPILASLARYYGLVS